MTKHRFENKPYAHPKKISCTCISNAEYTQKPSNFLSFNHEYRELLKEVALGEGRKQKANYFYSTVRNRPELQRKIAKGRRFATFSLASLSFQRKNKTSFHNKNIALWC